MSRPSRIAAMVLGLGGALACAKTSHSGSDPELAEGGRSSDGGAPVASSGDAGVANAAGTANVGGPPASLGTAQDVTTLWAGGGTYVCWLRASGELRCTSSSSAQEFIDEACLLDGCGPPREPPRIDLGTAVEVEQVLVGDVNEPIILGYAHSTQRKVPSQVHPPSQHGIVVEDTSLVFDETDVVVNGGDQQAARVDDSVNAGPFCWSFLLLAPSFRSRTTRQATSAWQIWRGMLQLH